MRALITINPLLKSGKQQTSGDNVATRKPNVTGEGAKYVAAARKQQAATAGKRMGQAHDRGMSRMYMNAASSPSEVAPEMSSTSTGVEHLSPQFNSKPAGQVSSMMPGAAGMSHGAVKRTTAMHPGGAGMGGPRFVVSSSKPKANPNYIAGSGNTRASGHASPNLSAPAPQVSANSGQSAGMAYWSGLGMGGTAQPKVRGNPQPMNGTPVKTGRVRAAVAKVTGKGNKKNKPMPVHKLIPRPSRHAGKLSEHLRSATSA